MRILAKRNIFANLLIDNSLQFNNSPDSYSGNLPSPLLVNINPNRLYTLESLSVKFFASYFFQTPIPSSIINSIQGGLILFLTNSQNFGDIIKVNIVANSPPGITTSGLNLRVSDVSLDTVINAGSYDVPSNVPAPEFSRFPVLYGDSIVRIFPTHSNYRQNLSTPITQVDTNFQDSLNVVFNSFNYRFLGIGYIPFSNFNILISNIAGNGFTQNGSLFFGANLIEQRLT